MATKNHFSDIAGNELLGKLEVDDAKMKLNDVKLFTIRRAFKHHFPGGEWVDKRTGEVQTARAETKLVVEFAEFPGKGLTCNKTQGAAFAALVSKGFLPNEFDEITNEFAWGGIVVPMVARGFDYEGKKFVKLSPVSSDSYMEQMKKLGGQVAASGPSRRSSSRR